MRWDDNKSLASNMRAEEQRATVPLSLVRMQGHFPVLVEKIYEIQMAAVKIVNERWEREGLIDINQWPSYQAAYDEWSEEVHFVIETFIQNIKVGP